VDWNTGGGFVWGAGAGGAARLRGGFDQDSQPVGKIPRKGNNISRESQALSSLIAAAYGVRTNQIFGPTWLSEELFDVQARTPEVATDDQVNATLQTLLKVASSSSCIAKPGKCRATTWKLLGTDRNCKPQPPTPETAAHDRLNSMIAKGNDPQASRSLTGAT